MDFRDRQLSLLQDLLGAPGSQEGWHTFLLHLCDAVGGSAASFISHRYASNSGGVAITVRTDPQALAKYQEVWSRFDPWACSPATRQLPSGAVLAGHQLIDRRAMQRTAFYNEFGRHYDLVQCLAGMIDVSPQGVSCLSINAGERRQLFDSHDVALIERLMSHLQRAIEIHRRLEGAELLAVDATAVLDCVGNAVLLVSARGRVMFANAAATAMLRSRDGLELDHDEVRGSTPAMTSVLRTAIAAALRSPGDLSRGSTGVMLPRPSGRRPLSVMIAALPENRAFVAAGTAAAVMFVMDPERSAVPDVETIRAMFQLTTAEAQLVRCVVEGESLRQTAVRLGVCLETVRTRLKDIFAKTDTHRQQDLVRLVLTSTTPGVRESREAL